VSIPHLLRGRAPNELLRDIPDELKGANIFFVEEVAYQKAAIQEMERMMIPVVPMKPQGDKRARLGLGAAEDPLDRDVIHYFFFRNAIFQPGIGGARTSQVSYPSFCTRNKISLTPFGYGITY
jgi:hypothetical protein